MKMDFTLNERLSGGCFEVIRMHGCRILLKNETNFPWFIVVPEVPQGIEDLHQLDDETFDEVMHAVRKTSRFVEGHFRPEKLNVACIGNIVRQMHIHVVGRSTDDPAWPGVVWAFDGKGKYGEGDAEKIISAAREFLERC
jgi:diadenosine tetraphosphate (Ap4A) HIT family hydrolase